MLSYWLKSILDLLCTERLYLPSNTYITVLTPNVMIFGDEDPERQSRLDELVRVGPYSEISGFTREDMRG
jgi:hypothetical protein